jgi:hypothetical protein
MVLEIYPFQSGKILAFIIMVIMFAMTIYYMERKKLPYIRRVAAIDAVDQAIGRATELGKPIICSVGISDPGTSTMAALSVLQYVTEACVRNEVDVLVPLGGSEAYSTHELAREIVQNEYRLAGKPEKYNPDNLPFLSARQFSWANAYVGMIVRSQAAANILMGGQLASAVYMAEVANTMGCLQISTAGYLANIACLAVASDYIMIGEEALAAGAYLSKDAVQLASIKTQDILKYAEIIAIIAGTLLTTFGIDIVQTILST